MNYGDLLEDEYDLGKLSDVVPSGRTFSMFVQPSQVPMLEDGSFEPFTGDLLASVVSRARLFVDVGAHCGFYTLLVGTRNPEIDIISLEPVPENFAILKKNIERHELCLVEAIEAAASSTNGRTDFMIVESSGACGISQHPLFRVLRTIEVGTVTLDDLLAHREPVATVVKIDVEGHEIEVLAGMKDTLTRFRDIALFIEFNPPVLKSAGHEPMELVEELERLGFALYLLHEEQRLPYRLKATTDWADLMTPLPHANLYGARRERALSICFFNNTVGLGGAERSLVELVTELVADCGAVCATVVPQQGPLCDGLLKACSGIVECSYEWWCSVEQLSECNVEDLLGPSVRNVLGQLLTALKRIGPDVVVTQTMCLPWGALAATLLGKPHVWSVCEHGESDHGFHFFFSFEAVKNDIVNSSAFIFANSKDVALNLFPDLGPDRQAVLYRHIPEPKVQLTEDRARWYRKAKAIRLGMFAIIKETKGQADAVLALARLVAEGRDVELLLAGWDQGPYRRVLDQIIETNDLVEHIRIVGFLTDPYPAMADTDIILVCSRREAFGRVLVEGMLLGKPVIYADEGAPKEYMIDGVTGLAYPRGNPGALSEKIGALIDDPEFRVRLGTQAQAYARAHFTKEEYGHKAYRLLKNICNGDPDAARMPSTIRGLVAATIGKVFSSEEWHRQELDRNRVAMEGLRQELDQNRAATEGLRQELDQDRVAMEGLRQELDRNRVAMEGLRQELDQNRAATEGLQQELNQNRRAMEGLRQELDQDRAATEGLQQELNQNKSDMESLQRELQSIKTSLAWKLRVRLGLMLEKQPRIAKILKRGARRLVG